MKSLQLFLLFQITAWGAKSHRRISKILLKFIDTKGIVERVNVDSPLSNQLIASSLIGRVENECLPTLLGVV